MKKLLEKYCYNRYCMWMQTADDVVSYSFLGYAYPTLDFCLKKAKKWKTRRDKFGFNIRREKLSCLMCISEDDIFNDEYIREKTKIPISDIVTSWFKKCSKENNRKYFS